MESVPKKLPPEAKSQLRLLDFDAVCPPMLVLTPIYVYLSQNEKFVAVKSAYQFFDSEELQSLKGYRQFYIPLQKGSVAQYQDVAIQIRNLLLTSDDSHQDFSTFELERKVYEKLDLLWTRRSSKTLSCDWQALNLFVNTLCNPYQESVVSLSSQLSLEKVKEAVRLSSLVVFLKLLMGYIDVEYLSEVRTQVFLKKIDSKRTVSSLEIEHWFEWINECLPDLPEKFNLFAICQKSSADVAQKLKAQLKRLAGNRAGNLFRGRS